MFSTSKSLQMPLDIEVIKELLPHKYPFLLIDRVISLRPGEYGVGVKNVTFNEPFFQGHFPGESLMPGVLIVEAMAQLIAVVYVTQALEDNADSEEENLSNRVGYLVSIKNMKFMGKVAPGDQLHMHAKVEGKFGALSQVKVWCEVEGKKVVDGIISVIEKE
ncbi:beta-hydroxyacyl-ACP dehydratase [Virgibacillus dokdonensis]|uniref:3-hydroxyacyl-[acyl-carrier-protein] dehydratase n=1 Tax=Virgibacillus dokdonensis TaxID=302167 RepID=A0A3E0WJ10_9BACI|nr:3-hydroxyacyl-ACP dehydratase FabZ [Virgibacillus dokdonensis]RFA32962.1 beta-hydroxyacyl-ACP dehydratase [Virgibacillus dokdonensis]